MTTDNEEYKENCLEQLESLRQVFIEIKTLYACTIPDETFKICDKHFQFFNIETRKMILGKLYILLRDEYKSSNGYNTISFKILIKSILKVRMNSDTESKLLNELLKKIEAIDDKYAELRDKIYAHIELNSDNTLKSLNKLNITNIDITYLLELSQDIYDQLFPLLTGNDLHLMEVDDPPNLETIQKIYEDKIPWVIKCKDDFYIFGHNAQNIVRMTKVDNQDKAYDIYNRLNFTKNIVKLNTNTVPSITQDLTSNRSYILPISVSTNHMKEEIEKLSKKIWEAYQAGGLIKKI